ncbi:MAG: aldehyde dehydrogenase family protein, partial [Halioglobus sp.]|nr:aldehyde dehydrogenase family protein [Halioglobus sp.]
AEVSELVAHPQVDAVSLTGSEQAGRAVAAICVPTGKPLQAELGGNNALLVLADADMQRQVAIWVRMAFGFAGQRCTAVRRFVVERAALDTFIALFNGALQDLQIGSPAYAGCDVGPLISAGQLNRVASAVESALARGAAIVARCDVDISAGAGLYYPPTLLAGLPVQDPLVQDELFGPVAVLQVAEDFEHGVELVNAVRQGLLAGIATETLARLDEFADRVEAGILVDGHGMKLHPAAPFGGRKASQIGPPEHGIWDREFFSRVQVRYRSSP